MGDLDREQPSLEPPKLFGRKKRTPKPAQPGPADGPAADPAADPAAAVEPEPAPEAQPELPIEFDDGPGAEDEAEVEAETDADADVVLSPAGVSAPDDAVEPEPEGPATVLTPAAAAVPDTEAAETAVFDDAAVEVAATDSAPDAVEALEALDEAQTPVGILPVATPPKPAEQPKAPKAPKAVPRSERAPLLPGRAAALVTGVLVGLGLLGLTFLGFRTCEAIKGTESCGTAPGLAFLTLIFALAVIGGKYLLDFFRIPDPGSTSFLAVGLTAVIALLFFIDVLDTWPMLIVVPVIAAGSYLLSWWVTTTYVEPHA